MYKFNFLIPVMCFLTVFTFTVSAQSLLTGTVRDAKTNEAITGVNIVAKERQLGTITDNNGNYELRLPEGTHSIMFSFIGYETVTKEIKAKGQPVNLNVSLTESAVSLGEVRVTAKSEARQIREQAMPISVITMHELQGTVSDVSDVLSKTSGVKIRTSGGVGSSSRISVRGLEGKRIGFFIDETPLSDNTDFLDINDIPIDLIDRVEIYKGIVPAKLGGSAVGGAVNIVLKEYPPSIP